MSSIIEGYNYDIFISYRQKDNKGDGWVSQFVEALKIELEATFKEDISIYFDENPADGLLETHNVDKSLEDKLKCLIFIPVVSQTYCDQKSYAWQNEFCEFNKLSKGDQFGRDIKLASGNVASRILPVKIHDLDPEDTGLLEDELGGVLRSIEFIFRASGVNRPLKPDDDARGNLNNTNYRNQINKVANAIKEIVSAMKHPEQSPGRISGKSDLQKPGEPKNRISRIIAGSIIALLLIAAGLIFVPKLFKSDDQIEKSIAVLPFRNDSPDQENSAFVNGLMEKILNNLQLIKDFRVLSRTTVEQYRDQSKSATEIARELGVNYIVEGSGQRFGDAFSLSVQLIKADKKEDHLWGKTYEPEIRKVEDILKIQSEIARAIAKELEANLSTEEKQRIDRVSTESLTALDFYQTGREEYVKYQTDKFNLKALDKAESFFNKALEFDPAFADAYVGLALVYWDQHAVEDYLPGNYLDSVLVLVNKALSYDNGLAEAYGVRGYYYWVQGYFEQAVEEFNKAVDINPSYWEAYQGIGRTYLFSDFLEALKNFHKAMSVARGHNLAYLLEVTGGIYASAGFPEMGRKYIEEKLELDDDSASYFESLGTWSSDIKYMEKALALDSTNLLLYFSISGYYSFNGNYEKALVYIEKGLELLDQTLEARFRDSGMQNVGYIYWKNNRFDEADYYFDLQVRHSTELIDSDRPLIWWIYPRYDRAGVYAFRGEKEKAYDDLRNLNQGRVLPLQIIAYLNYDPLFDSIRDEPEFQQIIRDNEAKFQTERERIRKWLEENDML